MKSSVYAAAGFALATTGLASGQSFVIDQIGRDDGSTLIGPGSPANQYFEPAYSQYDIAALDDFTIGGGLTITSVEAVIGGFNGYVDTDSITGYQVNIYSSPAAAGMNLVGDVFSQDFDTPTSSFVYPVMFGSGTSTNSQFDVNMELAAGTYWVSVIPTNVFGTGPPPPCQWVLASIFVSCAGYLSTCIEMSYTASPTPTTSNRALI